MFFSRNFHVKYRHAIYFLMMSPKTKWFKKLFLLVEFSCFFFSFHYLILNEQAWQFHHNMSLFCTQSVTVLWQVAVLELWQLVCHTIWCTSQNKLCSLLDLISNFFPLKEINLRIQKFYLYTSMQKLWTNYMK